MDRGEVERDVMRFPCALLPLLLIAFAPSSAVAAPPERESTVIVYGDDPCPRGEGEEVVVCARRPESERYRVPRPIRERQRTEVAWGARVESLDEASRTMRPGSCSVVGSFGMTGCTQEMIRIWYAERRARRMEDESVP